MKTPREILLAQHRSIEPKLEAVRERALRELHRDTRKARSIGLLASIQELFRLPRAAWSGLAAAWLVIISLNVASREESESGTSAPQTATRSPETQQALHEQRRLFAELVGSISGQDADRPPVVPGPRSERKCVTVTA